MSRIATRESSQSVERIGSEESPLNPPSWLLVVSLALAASGGVRGEEPDRPREPPEDKLSFGIGLHYLKSCLCRQDSGRLRNQSADTATELGVRDEWQWNSVVGTHHGGPFTPRCPRPPQVPGHARVAGNEGPGC